MARGGADPEAAGDGEGPTRAEDGAAAGGREMWDPGGSGRSERADLGDAGIWRPRQWRGAARRGSGGLAAQQSCEMCEVQVGPGGREVTLQTMFVGPYTSVTDEYKYKFVGFRQVPTNLIYIRR
jgi:hypothetical protein